MTPAQFRELYVARIKALRETKFTSSEMMATALGVSHETYRKYESRSPMPLDLVERFALIVGVPIDFVVTGRYVKGKGPYPPNIPGPHSLDEKVPQAAAR